MRRALVALFALAAGCTGSQPCESGGTARDLWADADADGFTAAEPTSVCTGDANPEGWLPAATTVDCDDTDPTMHAGAPDIAGDGIDQDCDGEDAANKVTADTVYVDAANAACQDDAPGTPDAPNCSLGDGSVFTSLGGTVYVASGEQTWWFLQVGRTYLGGRNPTDWSRDLTSRTVINTRRYIGVALPLEGIAGGYETVIEGFHAIGEQGGSQWNFAVYWEGPEKLVLRDVHIEGGGDEYSVSSSALQVSRGEVEVIDSILDGGGAPSCWAVYNYGGDLSISNSSLVGCEGASYSRMVANEYGDVRLSDVYVGAATGITDTVGIEVTTGGRVFLTAVTLESYGVHDTIGVWATGADTRVEIKESAVRVSEKTASAIGVAVLAEDGATVIAANSAFQTTTTPPGTGFETPAARPAVDAYRASLTLVNTQLISDTIALRVDELSTVELVANNLWGARLSVLLGGVGTITSVDDVNGCDWEGCALASDNTSHNPGYVDLAGGSFEVSAVSPLVDIGVDPTPYGLIVDRDIEGKPSPSDGDGDGLPMWDVGPHER